MVKVIFYRSNNDICRFVVSGHAGFSEEGFDIVCSAVSILVLNTVNSIEEFTDESFSVDIDEKNGGLIDCVFPDMKPEAESYGAQLLLKAMAKGLKDIEKEYSNYICIIDEEV